jgi:LysM repeat protein
MFAKRMIQISLVLVLLVSSLAVTRGVSADGLCGSTYVVQRGDWLSKIAVRCGVSLSQLYAANPWVGYYIYPGQVLNIPGGNYYGGPVYGSGEPVPGSGGPVYVNSEPRYNNGYYSCGPTSSAYYGNYYVVCRGDTLGRIARYYGESVSYLQWHNHIANANRIYAGQFIFP